MIRKDEGGLFMEVALVIGMFVCTALALNFLVNGRRKLSGTFEIINLCLIVATAYQFKLVSSIIWVLVILAILLIAGLIFNKKRKDKKIYNTGRFSCNFRRWLDGKFMDTQ